jgi:SAM-dependent MidA family methyltransferase
MQGQTGHAGLLEELALQLRQRDGLMTFAEFMEAALYHPQFGYYTRADSPIGPGGDFFTAVSATPILGRILARYFQRLEAGRVVEFGGHRGQLRKDVLAEAPGLDYRIVEAGDAGPDEIEGVVFSNELLDAFPVHRVRVVRGAWRELYVGEGFAFEEGPLSDQRLATALAGLPVDHMEGYETEVNLRAQDWMASIGRRLRRGHVVTIDYGYERTEFYSPHRPQGTLRCYYRHKMTSDPLQRIGEQDITAHVEFTSVIEAGRKAGLEPVVFTDLSSFLIKEGADVIREVSERTAGAVSRERQGIHQLLHVMGQKFKVLVQKKCNL